MPKTRFFTPFFRVKKLLVIFIFSSSFVFNLTGGTISSWAATDTVTNEAKVSLRIVDNINPSTPILIAPENNSYVATGTPTFHWQESSDDRGIAKYQLWLNGSLYYDNLPTGNQETSNYVYTHSDGEYRLRLKNVISDGTYTWKIRVYDINGNFSESATWSFIIDTLAPAFVINSIGEIATSISAQDLNTIPTSPIELDNNEPLLVATGEPNSVVVVTVSAPGEPVRTYTTTIDANGNWSLQLGVFTRGDIITLDFTITDPAGLVSVLNNVQFVVKKIVIVFPPASPTPSPSPTPQPTPGVSPEPTPSFSPEPQPSPEVKPPLIEIPITPPREIILTFFQKLYNWLPDFVKVWISSLPVGLVKIIKELAPISAALIATALPVASAIAVATQFGGNLSLQLFLRLLQALGLLPIGEPQGLVFNSETYQPVPFAVLTIYSEGSEVQIAETVVTDAKGVYKGIKLAPGLYRIIVSHQDFTFPSSKNRPIYVQFKDYYLGEVFNVTSEKQQQLFLIPIDPREKSTQLSLTTRLRIFLASVGRFTQHLAWPLFLISGLLFLVFPTLWNGLVLTFYTLLISKRLIWTFKRPLITGLVVDRDKRPLENAVIRVIEPNTNQISSIITTGRSGRFKIYADKGLYHLEAIRVDYVWTEVTAAMSFYQVDASKKPQDLVIVMESAESA